MRRFALACCAAVVTTMAAPAFAGLINYGDFAADNVDYLDVSEFSPTDPLPLYRAPTVSGNSLIFDEITFAALASGSGGIDATTGVLSTTISAHPGEGISSLFFRESGSYSLAGLVNDAFASVSAAYIISVLEVDGMPVDPINFDTLMTFNPSDGDYSIGEDGAGAGVWEGLLDVNVGSLLASRGRQGNATRVSVTITNMLTALSQDGTTASILKKNLSISSIPAPPTAIVLVFGAASRRRRRRA